MLLTLLCVATASAAVPFEVTTVENGEFAAGTTWYTITIGSGKLLLCDNGSATSIEPTQTVYDGSDAILWCFTGNEEEGYRLYNKQAGAGKVLASPATLSGDGGTSYPVLKAAGSLGTDVACYDFAVSDRIAGESGYYISQHGKAANAMNLYGGQGKLAFWTGGKDAGSTFLIAPAVADVAVAANAGTFEGTGNWRAVFRTTGEPAVTLNSGVNNIAFNTSRPAFDMRTGTSGSSTYNLTVSEGYRITSFRFNIKQVGAGTITVKTGSSAEARTLTAEGFLVEETVQEGAAAQFVLAGSNVETGVSDFVVSVERTAAVPEDQVNVIPTRPGDIATRIPAIATAQNGNVIVVADYRHPGAGADIGMATNGRLDLRFTLTSDHGKTWSPIKALVEGRGAAAAGVGDEMWVAFGDPIAVGDRESARVLVMSCCGNVSFLAGTRQRHQGIARFYSDDNGVTWSEPVNIAEPLYEMLDRRKDGPIRSMFIGSGKATQSRTVKVGSHYRLYCAALARINSGAHVNFVLYSDDFGMTWNFLGGVDADPIPSGGDEPKAEELPDGSVIISSRTSGGRLYNIFHFTDAGRAEGSWGRMAFSGAGNNGTTALDNSTNGEILIVPVTRRSDNRNMFLALQSLPLGSGRSNVGIYYKELASLEDFASPDSIAKNWDGCHQASHMSSAYSTMTLQKDNTIGFVYEESTLGATYTIVYKNYSIDYLTDSLYTFCEEDIDTDAFVAEKIDCRVASLTDDAHYGENIGQYKAEARTLFTEALDAYKQAPSRAAYEALNAVIQNAPRNEVEEGKWYRLRNRSRHDGTYGLKGVPATSAASAGYAGALQDKEAEDQVFQFRPAGNGTYTLYNASINLNVSRTLGTSKEVPAVRRAEDAGKYTVTSFPDGTSTFICTNSLGGYNGLHLDASDRLVAWTTQGSPASLWHIEPSTLEPVVPTAYESLRAAIREAEQFMASHTEGDLFGEYDYATLRATLGEARALTAETEESVLLAAGEAVYDAIDNCPMNGRNAFIRIRSAASAYAEKPYLTGANSSASANRAAFSTDGTTAESIFYYGDDKKLLSYSSGNYLANMSNFAGYGNADTDGTLVTFSKLSGKQSFHLQFNDGARYLYCQYRNSAYYADAGGSPGSEEKYTYEVEIVGELPVRIPPTGFKAIYTPVALTLPEGLNAWTFTLADGALVPVPLAGAIPAGTGVLLEGAAGLHYLPVAAEAPAPVASDLLGQLDAASMEADSRYLFNIVGGRLGFYMRPSTTISGFTPYLPLADGVESYLLDIVSGIEELPSLSGGEEYYDLSGRRVIKPAKGLYVTREGRKVFLR